MADLFVRWSVAACAVVGLSSPVLADGAGKRVLDAYVEPSISTFAISTGRLKTSLDALCAGAGEATLAAARKSFAAALGDFGRLSVVRFGPLATESRFERLFFWPDPRGIGLKQVQGLVALADAAQIAAGMAGKSAALQGFPALEFVLHGTGSEKLASADSWRCSVGAAIAGNVAAIARELAHDWKPDTPFATSFAMPGGGREPYRSEAEVQAEIVKALSTALQFVRSAELSPPLGEEPAKANGKRAPFWRSDLTARFVSAQIDGVRQMLAAAGYEETLPEDNRYVASSIRFEIDNAIRALGQVEGSIEGAFAADPDRGRFAFALLALHHANELVNDNLSAALGLSMGFNALDGD